MKEIIIGECIGDTCNRNGCNGSIQSTADDGMSCSCHINPPCGKCTAPLECSECDYSSDVD